jgi:CheY-like chemotaxis protein
MRITDRKKCLSADFFEAAHDGRVARSFARASFRHRKLTDDPARQGAAIDTTVKLGQECEVLFEEHRVKLRAMDRSILIVDDEENLLLLLDRILSREGYQVKTANSAIQALDFVDRGSFDAAILDIKMYPIDGIALLAEIKKRSPDTEVIMITAYPTADSRNDCMKQGAATYLTKPLEIQELKTVLRDLLAA